MTVGLELIAALRETVVEVWHHALMAWPPKPRWYRSPVIAVLTSALIGWILLAALMSDASLDRADKAASVISMLIGLGALIVAVIEIPRRLAARQQGESGSDGPESTDGADWRNRFLKRPSVLIALGAMLVGLVVVLLFGLATGNSPSASAPTDAPTATVSPPSSTTATESPSPSPLERCASPVAGTESLAPRASSALEEVRHEGPLVLSKGFHADLDSLCSDWDITDVSGSRQDITNDGKGLVRSFTAGTQIAVVQRSAPATYAMCAANTDYLSETLRYRDLAPGNRYCVVTDTGRRSLITVKGTTRTTIQLDVKTWAHKPPGDDTDYGPWILGGIVLLVLLGGGAKKASGNSQNP
ncbi:hypothetical protein ACWEOR_28835 [Micromonospora chalcea]